MCTSKYIDIYTHVVPSWSSKLPPWTNLVQNFTSSAAINRHFEVEYLGLQWLLRAACIQSAGTGNAEKQSSQLVLRGKPLGMCWSGFKVRIGEFKIYCGCFVAIYKLPKIWNCWFDRFRYELFELMRHRVRLVDTKEAFPCYTLTFGLKEASGQPVVAKRCQNDGRDGLSLKHSDKLHINYKLNPLQPWSLKIGTLNGSNGVQCYILISIISTPNSTRVAAVG